MAGWFNKEILSIADLEGLKLRIPGLGGEVFQRSGGVAVSMPGSEMFSALQTGVIDATERVGSYNGAEVRRLPDDMLGRFAELSKDVFAEAAADDELAGRILASYQSFLAEVRDYHAISEQAYINSRDAVETAQ